MLFNWGLRLELKITKCGISLCFNKIFEMSVCLFNGKIQPQKHLFFHITATGQQPKKAILSDFLRRFHPLVFFMLNSIYI